MSTYERLGNEALTKLKTFLSRRALLRAGAGLGLAATVGQTQRSRARAAQDAICGGEEIKLTNGFWDDAQRPAVEQQIAAFKQLHPDVAMQPQVVPWDD